MSNRLESKIITDEVYFTADLIAQKVKDGSAICFDVDKVLIDTKSNDKEFPELTHPDLPKVLAKLRSLGATLSLVTARGTPILSFFREHGVNFNGTNILERGLLVVNQEKTQFITFENAEESINPSLNRYVVHRVAQQLDTAPQFSFYKRCSHPTNSDPLTLNQFYQPEQWKRHDQISFWIVSGKLTFDNLWNHPMLTKVLRPAIIDAVARAHEKEMIQLSDREIFDFLNIQINNYPSYGISYLIIEPQTDIYGRPVNKATPLKSGIVKLNSPLYFADGDNDLEFAQEIAKNGGISIGIREKNDGRNQAFFNECKQILNKPTDLFLALSFAVSQLEGSSGRFY